MFLSVMLANLITQCIASSSCLCLPEIVSLVSLSIAVKLVNVKRFGRD